MTSSLALVSYDGLSAADEPERFFERATPLQQYLQLVSRAAIEKAERIDAQTYNSHEA